MKFIKKNIYKSVIISTIIILFILVLVFFVSKNNNQFLIKKQIISKTDYRIFACGEEIFLKPDLKLLKTKRNSLFESSKPGSIIVSGAPSNIEDLSLASFFDAVGGALEFSDENKNFFAVPTESGLREFRSGDICNGKEANLYVLHYRVEASTKPWPVYSQVMWKYFDYILTSNYNKDIPSDCLVFIFDSEDVLDSPWPYCSSYDDALSTGELVLQR